MKSPLALLLFLMVNVIAAAEWTPENCEAEVDSLKGSVQELTKAISDLSRQTMLQQFGVEERSRISSDSGIKVIRSRNNGLKNYESPSHVGNAVNAIHDHANYLRTLGMGEVSVMMNGINFRTRHNDYKLAMPSTSSREFRATEKIPIPEVPPNVTGTLDEQVQEMREWFKAFKNQDYTVRDYRNYFKPVLCYIEGTWTLDKELQEPFSSDRHQIDASSWFDLQEKLQFTSYTGSKSNKENLAYLPTAILSVDEENGIANYAQWNYRILCQPLKRDVPLSTLKYVDDLAYRMRDGKSVEQTLLSRAARFKLFDDKQTDRYQILDELFYEVPGMDNVPFDNLTQATLGDAILLDVASTDRRQPLKTGYYHRQYKFMKKGAMGQTVNPRGFNDENLWVAQNTQARVAPVSLEVCPKRGKKECQYVQNRFSYALPLELIYMTPLLSWNPFNITINDNAGITQADGANGKTNPYHGVDKAHYYLTPYQFFGRGQDTSQDPADTSKGSVNVYDPEGQVQKVMASGTKIILKEIPDVGQIRLRYPIAPVSDEGSSVWEELTALKDLVFTMREEMKQMAENDKDDIDDVEPEEVYFQMSPTTKDPPGEHTHDFSMPYKVFKEKLLAGKLVWVETELRQGHSHTLRVKYNPVTKKFLYVKCGSKKLCWDEHGSEITLLTKNKFTVH